MTARNRPIRVKALRNCVLAGWIVTCALLGRGTVAQADDYVFGNARDKKDFTVWIVSSRAGLCFTDGEPVDVRVRVGGAAEAVTVDYAVQEAEGPWQAKGSLSLEKGTAEKPLPLNLPGRGLFNLSLSAKSGVHSARAETNVAVVFPPTTAKADSPWGTINVLFGPPSRNPTSTRETALCYKRLGASWIRFCFWGNDFDKVTIVEGNPPSVKADYPRSKALLQAFRREGLFIMGNIVQCPRALSSKPNDETQFPGRDCGPLWCRAKPLDYRVWDRFAEWLAADLKEEVQVWEIWNEPQDAYWSGTREEFSEFVAHTGPAFRRGNPQARIAGCSFVPTDMADTLFRQGLGKYIDILTVHYTEQGPGSSIESWKALLKKHDLAIPIWNTEEKAEIPLQNLIAGIPCFKFGAPGIAGGGYEDFYPLTRADGSLLPPAIRFSVGAHCIGNGKFSGVDRDKLVPGFDLYFFQRGDEKVAVFHNSRAPAKLLDPNSKRAKRVTLKIEPLFSGQPATVTDVWGRSRALEIRDGRAELSLADGFMFINGALGSPLLEPSFRHLATPRSLADGFVFINGARTVEIVKAETPPPAQPAAFVFEAESGKWSNGWSNNPHAGYSENKLLEIWTKADPGPEGYWAEVKFNLPADGKYELIFAGNKLEALVAGKGWMSAFSWTVDGGMERKVESPLPVIKDVAGAPQGISVLESLDLKAGEHIFRLRLLRKNDPPHNTWAMWFDAIALRPLSPSAPADP